jgi:hypothetical protein
MYPSPVGFGLKVSHELSRWLRHSTGERFKQTKKKKLENGSGWSVFVNINYNILHIDDSAQISWACDRLLCQRPLVSGLIFNDICSISVTTGFC